MNRCYVYAYRVDGALWYIGKGSGSRIGRHLRRAKRHAKGLPMHRIAAWQIDLSNALATGSIVTIEKLADNLPEPVALSLEIDLIAEKQAAGRGRWEDCQVRTAKTPPRNINSAPYWHEDPTKPVTYHMTVRILPRATVQRLTVLSCLERFGDEAGTHPATEREMVALIRHCLINRRPNTPALPASRYHNSVDNFRHRIALTSATAEEFTERLAEFKRLCLRLIGEAYPYLKEECDRQRASVSADTRSFDYHAARRNAS